MLDPRIPDVEHVHRHQFAHVLAVAAGAADRGFATGRACQPVGSGGQHERGDEALDVPFPRGRQRLVEVVDVKHQPPFRRGEAAEIEQVRVAAGLDAHAAGRRRREVRRHHRGRASVESEWRGQHPAVSDRHELRQPRGVGGVQSCDWVSAVRGLSPRAVDARETLSRRPFPAAISAAVSVGCGAGLGGALTSFTNSELQ